MGSEARAAGRFSTRPGAAGAGGAEAGRSSLCGWPDRGRRGWRRRPRRCGLGWRSARGSPTGGACGATGSTAAAELLRPLGAETAGAGCRPACMRSALPPIPATIAARAAPRATRGAAFTRSHDQARDAVTRLQQERADLESVSGASIKASFPHDLIREAGRDRSFRLPAGLNGGAPTRADKAYGFGPVTPIVLSLDNAGLVNPLLRSLT